MKRNSIPSNKQLQKKQKEEQEEEEDEDERMLKSMLFGGREWVTAKANEEEDTSKLANDSLFSLDTKGASSNGGAAWEDSDDEDVTVDLAANDRLRKLRESEAETTVTGVTFAQRLREQHAKLAAANGTTSGWAKLPTEPQDEDESALKQASSLLAEKGAKRRAEGLDVEGRLSIRKLNDAVQPSNCVIQALDWHAHSSNVFLSGGMDKTLKLFQLTGRKDNKLLQSVYFTDLPIHCALFSESEVVLTGNRPFYYTYDVESGKLNKMVGILGRREQKHLGPFTTKQGQHAFALNDGYISLVDPKSRMEVAYCKSGSSCQNLKYMGSHTLIAAGSDGEIRNWDLRHTAKPVWKREDEGSDLVTALACNESMYAVGSKSGIVSVYGMESGNKIKQVMNLTTWIDSLDFNSTGSLLAISSREKKNAVRLLHLPTNQIVTNFPDPKARLNKVQRVRFSKRGGVLSCGNDRGQVLLWKGLNV